MKLLSPVPLSPTSSPDALLFEILTKVNHLVDLEGRRERRRRRGIVFSIIRFFLYIAIPVGVGYAFIEYFEDIFPAMVQEMTRAIQESLKTGAPPQLEISEPLLEQLKNILGNVQGKGF